MSESIEPTTERLTGTADGFLYYVMPFIDGETLRDELNHEPQLSIDEAIRITQTGVCGLRDAGR